MKFLAGLIIGFLVAFAIVVGLGIEVDWRDE